MPLPHAPSLASLPLCLILLKLLAPMPMTLYGT